MIPLLGREAVRALDAAAIDAGVPGVVLMENAGLGATRALLERFGERLERIVIVGGPGQNGGDAWVIARQLIVHGLRPRALAVVDDASRIAGDAATNLAALRSWVDVEEVAPADFGSVRLEGSLLIDGLFGTGLDRPIEGAYAEVVRRLDEAPAPVVALDLPSGVCADTGAILGCAPRAALTLTFGAHKRGLFQFPAAGLAGEIVLATIGVPSPADADALAIEDADLVAALPPRRGDAHKGTAGHVVVVAGSGGTSGAALLAGRAAMRAGAGLVTLATRVEAMDQRVVELMTSVVQSADEALSAIDERAGSAVIGPGLGTDDLGLEMARATALEARAPAVLDADALTAFAGDLGALREAAGPRVLTPHPGEAGRLLGWETARVQRDRYAAAEALAEGSGQVVVLKGARTVICDGSRWRVSRAGTPALGVGGTGDVLAGIIGALLATGDPFPAAGGGVLWHALAGARAAVSDRGLLAHEVADALPATLSALRS